MMKFRNNLRWRFCYGGLMTHFLRAEGIEEETIDMTVGYHLDLTSKLVDVTCTKALDMLMYMPCLPNRGKPVMIVSWQECLGWRNCSCG
ncbi:hypothetical protein H5410_061698 [Solanum commersonii]|uniref:Uncharacterized protein n=1 Tax=Solanum commersonii TaxID=4109 RepID=A0A9J5W9K8_SOLCO|nr:hypothetical protein H5410_061698 [Solanum commersonii]